MLDLLKSLGGMTVIVSGIVTITYIIFTVGIYDNINMAKSNIYKNDIKQLIMLLMSIIVILVGICSRFSCAKENPRLEKYLFGPFWALTISYFFWYMLFLIIFHKKKKELNSNKSYEIKKTKYKVIVILMNVLLLFLYIASVLFYFNKLNLDYMYIFSTDWNKSWYLIMLTILFQILAPYILMVLSLGYIYFTAQFFCLKSAIIKSDVFEKGQAFCYVICENESEIKIKCENSYPMILKKDKIEVYIMLPDSKLFKKNQILLKDPWIELDHDVKLNKLTCEFNKNYKGIIIPKNESKKMRQN